LKYFEISTTSLGDFAGIGGGRTETVISFLTFLRSNIPVYLWIKLGLYFASERKVILVSNEVVPKGRNEPPSHFTNTFQVVDIVSLVTLNQFVKDVFLHSSERFFDMFDIRR